MVPRFNTRDLLSKPQPSVLQFSAGQSLVRFVVEYGFRLLRTVFSTVLMIRCSRVVEFVEFNGFLRVEWGDFGPVDFFFFFFKGPPP